MTIILASLSVGPLASVQGQGLGIQGNLIRQSDGSTAFAVHTVNRGGLANRLGIQSGDVVTSINGVAPADAAANQKALELAGGSSTIVVLRNGRPISLQLPPDGILPDGPVVSHRPGLPGRPGRPDGPFDPDRPNKPIELVPGQRGPNLQIQLQPSEAFDGLTVQKLLPRGLGAGLRFQLGDVITAVNGTTVNTLVEFSSAYIVSERRDIVVSVLRRGRSGTITINQETLRKASAPRGTILQPLKLKVFLDFRGQVTVGGGEDDGLGAKLGLKQRGVRILEVNGRAIRNGGDLRELDRQIEDGKVRRLVIKIIRPDGQSDTVVYP
ncbi:PDZ domain-containing protein [Rhodopirellula sp. JC639]|uniref:PDZ domain-containing protein n=1 Tax=Stieleria mannarensis TaxID=2755585 RepID=UPI0016010435|nr:PDZ domain-containing protein [Rhodopirellula sp. JC639]